MVLMDYSSQLLQKEKKHWHRMWEDNGSRENMINKIEVRVPFLMQAQSVEKCVTSFFYAIISRTTSKQQKAPSFFHFTPLSSSTDGKLTSRQSGTAGRREGWGRAWYKLGKRWVFPQARKQWHSQHRGPETHRLPVQSCLSTIALPQPPLPS